ncbi:glycosyltransferase family 2 protein [Pedobacter alpinus]|uniref:Glycosyltransferase family 2 protein n=1 Tax=Pedobacter alpinus TaxID=1590643 RepID=A0ABW5TQW8_9SPHI
MKKLLVIIPCYNEEDSIEALLKQLQALNLSPKWHLEIAVVNDCSKDKTLEKVAPFNIHLIDLPINLGIGGAVQSGLKFAYANNFDFAVQMDGDGQHPPQELIKLLNASETTAANLIIGSRFIEKTGFQSSFIRRIGINYFHILNKIFTGKSIYDSTSGFRLFDKKAIALTVKNYPDEYPEPETLVLFAKAGLKIHETPVIMAARMAGESSINSTASVYYCFKVTLAMFFTFIRKIQ